MNKTRKPFALSFALSLALIAMLLSLTGCQMVGWLAHGLTPEEGPPVIEPEYQGLIGKSVAVLVAVDERSTSPAVAWKICAHVSSRLASTVRDIRVVDSRQMIKFMKENPDWIATPHGELVREMKVDRVVHIDVAQFTTHEPGNKELWQGNLIARVGILEADAKDPYKFAYVTDQQVLFPPDQPIGMLKANDEVIQTGMLNAFTDRLAALLREPDPK